MDDPLGRAAWGMLRTLRETTTVTITGFVGLLARHWLLCAVCAVLGVLIAVGAALFVVTPSYTASARLYVSGKGASGDDRYTNGEYARTHVASYAEMVDSQEVLEAVRAKLGLPPSRGGDYFDLADEITASNPLDTLILEVVVKDQSPERAQAVAIAIGEVYDSVVGDIESPGKPAQSPVRITVVSPAALPSKQDSPSRRLYAVGGLLVGTAIGAAAAWLLEKRRARRPVPLTPAVAPEERWPWWPDDAGDDQSRKQSVPAWGSSSGVEEASNGSRPSDGSARKEHDPAAP